MALARNEGDGLRCVVHGWKVSVDEQCVDTPTEPLERRGQFAAKVPVRSHPVREAGGLVWVYLGQEDKPLRFPDFFNSDMGSLENMQHQDREATKNGHWSGIVGRGNAQEDLAVQQSMGPIVDRSKEHLGSCDLVILRARSMLSRAVEKLQKDGELSFVGPEVDFARMRAISFAFPYGNDREEIDAFNPRALEVA